MTDGLGSYGAALREVSELGATEHVTVSAAERQNNLICSHIVLPESRNASRGDSEQHHASKGFSLPTPRSQTCSAIPEPVRQHGCADVT